MLLKSDNEVKTFILQLTNKTDYVCEKHTQKTTSIKTRGNTKKDKDEKENKMVLFKYL